MNDGASAAESLRRYLQQIASRSSSAHKLEQIVERFDPDNPTLGVVHHANEQVYLLTRVPDDEASDLLCQRPGNTRMVYPAPERARADW